MARKKDLGGLAALAGLAYMASRDKAAKGEAREAPSSNDVASFAGTPDNDSNAGMTPEAGMMEKEPAENFKSTPRSTPRAASKPTGENYGNESRRPVREPSAATESKLNILEEAKEEARRRRAGAMAVGEASRPTMEVGRLPKKGPGLSNFKSGGSVKGWGIARGARKAKTY